MLDKHPVFKVDIQLAQFPAMTQHEQAQPVQLGERKTGRVGVVQNIGAMLVVVAV